MNNLLKRVKASQHIYREGNGTTDAMAKEGLAHKGYRTFQIVEHLPMQVYIPYLFNLLGMLTWRKRK